MAKSGLKWSKNDRKSLFFDHFKKSTWAYFILTQNWAKIAPGCSASPVALVLPRAGNIFALLGILRQPTDHLENSPPSAPEVGDFWEPGKLKGGSWADPDELGRLWLVYMGMSRPKAGSGLVWMGPGRFWTNFKYPDLRKSPTFWCGRGKIFKIVRGP